MNDRPRWTSCLLLLASLLSVVVRSAVGDEKRAAETGYSFTLDGVPFTPYFLSPTGVVDRPHEGDLFEVAQMTLTLGKPSEYSFTTTPDDDGRLFLKMADGPQKVIGVEVDFDYEDDVRVSINPLVKMSPEEIAGLRGIRLDDWPTGIEDRLRHLDLSRACVTVTDFASIADSRELPPIPAGVRYLSVTESSNSGFTDLSGLQRLAELRHLSLKLMTVRELDLGLLGENKELRLLRISCRGVKQAEALGALVHLQSLELPNCPGVGSIEFARKMPDLRRVDFRRTDIRDLSPLSDKDSLVYVNAEMSQVAKLPSGELAALRDLRLFSTPLADELVQDFVKAHPECKVLHRWMDAFRAEVAQADRLRIRSGGTCHRHESREKTLFEIKNAAVIQEIISKVELDEADSGGHCMCCGEPSFEFYEGDRLVAMVGFHHGKSIRWIGGWPADGVLTKDSAEALVTWLAENGVTGPQDAQLKRMQQEAALNRRFQLIFDVVPEAVAEKLKTARSPADAMTAFTSGVPDPIKRAEVCLRVLGCDTGSWNHYTQFESLVCRGLLPGIDQAALSAAVAAAAEDKVLADGAARWLFAERQQDTVTEKALADVLPVLAQAGLSHPRAKNRLETMLALGRIKSPAAIKALRDFVDGKYEARELPEDSTEPGGQVVFHPRKAKVDQKYSDKVNAALVLLHAGDNASRDRISRLIKVANAAEKKVLESEIQRLEK